MDDGMTLKNRERFIQLGIVIAMFRKMRGLSQEQLVERASALMPELLLPKLNRS